jgi:DNA-binding NtrC family response regulator
LFASTLFGHTRDAFTGATRDREGLVRSADGGDLFLDEISNMPPDVQVGLLRVLQEGEVVPVGADRGHKVNVRFLSATNQHMEERVARGRFGADLLERLRLGGAISLPPLRERSGDIPGLASAFLARAKTLVPGARVHEIVPEALELLRTSPWPRNIRALESAIHQAVTSNPDVEYLFPIHFRFLETVHSVASGGSNGTDARGKDIEGTVQTSAALADAILKQMLPSSVSGTREVDYQQSKSAIKRVVVTLCQEGRLQVPATIAAEAFFDETWRLLRMELKSRSLKWMAGRNPAFQNAARRSSELTRMACESIGSAKHVVPDPPTSD